MRHTSIWFFWLPVWFEWGFLALRASLGVSILVHLIRLHATPLMSAGWTCVSFLQTYTRALGESWKWLWILKSTQSHFMGRVKQRVNASFQSLFYAFDLSQCSSFSPSCTSDMKKLWKLIHFKDESVLATVLSHRSVSTGWTGIPVLSAGNISLKNGTWKMLGLLSLICFGGR